MLRLDRLSAILLLLVAAACGDLTRVPPPPVPLSAIDTPVAAVEGGGPMTLSQARIRLVHAMPRRGLAMMHLPDLAGTARRFKETSLYKLLKSPELEALFGPTQAAFAQFTVSAPSGPGGGFDPNKLLKSLKGEFAICLESVQLNVHNQPESARVLAGISVPGAEQQVDQLIEMVGFFAGNDPNTTVEKGTQDGTAFTRLVARKPVSVVVELALYGDALLIGVGRDSVTDAITRLSNNGADSLAESENYRRAMARCADPRDALRLHVDLAEVMARFGHLLPVDAQSVLELLGIPSYRSITTAVRLEGKDLVVSNYLDSPGGEDFLTSLLRRHPVDRQHLELIPAEATSFSLFAVDGNMILSHLRKNLRADWRKEMEKSLREMRGKGIDLEADITDVFGPRCALVTMQEDTDEETILDMIWSQLLGTAFAVEIRDEKRAAAVLDRLPKSAEGVTRRKMEIEGYDAVSYRFEWAQLPEEFAVSFAQTEDFVYVAATVESLRRMLKKHPQETAERYREMFKGVPESVAMLSYDSMQQGLGLMARAFVEGFKVGLENSGAALSFNASPMRLNTEDFNPSISYTVADEEGIFTFTRSPTAGIGGTGGIAGILMVSAIAIPNLLVARLHANETAAIARMRAIRTAQETFRNNTVRDGDRDGDGEYGFLVELMGRQRPGDRRVRNRSPLVSGLTWRPGIGWRSQGYYFRVYLPAEDGTPVGGHAKRARIKRVDGDLSEAIMVVSAWPVSQGTTGKRSFIMDASGIVWTCEDGPYGASHAPPPDVNNRQPGNLASRTRTSLEPARDGFHWTKLR